MSGIQFTEYDRTLPDGAHYGSVVFELDDLWGSCCHIDSGFDGGTFEDVLWMRWGGATTSIPFTKDLLDGDGVPTLACVHMLIKMIKVDLL